METVFEAFVGMFCVKIRNLLILFVFWFCYLFVPFSPSLDLVC